VFPIQENTYGRGLEIDFESCSLLQQKLEKQLSLYDQETQPYVISELVKQVIRVSAQLNPHTNINATYA